jgi:membrane-bound metal-dependent hydrolase YbcI (DUF457 family)
VFLWFVGMVMVISWNVFRDPALDHRLLALGVLVPLLVEAPIGHVGPLHTLVGAIAVLVAVMIATIGRRRLRRRLLALAIGGFLHLLLDGVWTIGHVFWWPLQGWSFEDTPLPELDRSLAAVLALEATGAVALCWAWFRFGLTDAGRRRRFVRDGRLDRGLTDPTPPGT